MCRVATCSPSSPNTGRARMQRRCQRAHVLERPRARSSVHAALLPGWRAGALGGGRGRGGRGLAARYFETSTRADRLHARTHGRMRASDARWRAQARSGLSGELTTTQSSIWHGHEASGAWSRRRVTRRAVCGIRAHTWRSRRCEATPDRSRRYASPRARISPPALATVSRTDHRTPSAGVHAAG